MNKPSRAPFDAMPLHADLSSDDLAKLRFLLNAVEIDSAGARLAFQVGKSRLTLHENGTLRLDGSAVIQTATQSITLDGALIELN